MKQKLLRRFKRKFSISAPMLSVRPHVPWYIRWAIALPIVLAASGLIWWAYDSGLEFAGFHRAETEQEIAGLREQIVALTSENAHLAAQSASYERQVQIEQATNLETSRQLQVANEENLRLKEDLTLFQNLTVSGTREGELSIQHFKVERDTLPGEYRYKLLLVQGGQQRAKPFVGSMQLLINVVHNGEKSVVTLPNETRLSGGLAEDAPYHLNFKYYLRIEHGFRVPDNVSIESVQVRIFERGASEPKTKQTVNLT